MNVASTSIAPASRSPSSESSCTLGASIDGQPDSFAGTMDAMRPADASSTQARRSAAPQAATSMDGKAAAADTETEANPAEIKAAVGPGIGQQLAGSGSDKVTCKVLHLPQAGLGNVSTKRETHVSGKPLPPKIAAAAGAIQSPAEQDSPVTPDIVVAAVPSAPATATLPSGGVAKSSTSVCSKGAAAPVAQTGDGTSQGAHSAVPVGAGPNQGSVAHAALPQDASSDTSEEPPFAENAFSGLAIASAETSPAAVFTPFLATEAPLTHPSHVSTDGTAPVSARASSSPEAASPQAAPVRKLEIALQDPILGNVDVRAEMRGGALHATLTSSQDSTTASMPALHQFLQGHDVTVHSLTYATARDGVLAAGATTYSSSDMRRETAGGSGYSSGSNQGSQTSQGNSSHQHQRSGTSLQGYDDNLFATAYIPRSLTMPAALVSSNALATGSRLSIHI